MSNAHENTSATASTDVEERLFAHDDHETQQQDHGNAEVHDASGDGENHSEPALAGEKDEAQKDDQKVGEEERRRVEALDPLPLSQPLSEGRFHTATATDDYHHPHHHCQHYHHGSNSDDDNHNPRSGGRSASEDGASKDRDGVTNRRRSSSQDDVIAKDVMKGRDAMRGRKRESSAPTLSSCNNNGGAAAAVAAVAGPPSSSAAASTASYYRHYMEAGVLSPEEVRIIEEVEMMDEANRALRAASLLAAGGGGATRRRRHASSPNNKNKRSSRSVSPTATASAMMSQQSQQFSHPRAPAFPPPQGPLAVIRSLDDDGDVDEEEENENGEEERGDAVNSRSNSGGAKDDTKRRGSAADEPSPSLSPPSRSPSLPSSASPSPPPNDAKVATRQPSQAKPHTTATTATRDDDGEGDAATCNDDAQRHQHEKGDAINQHHADPTIEGEDGDANGDEEGNEPVGSSPAYGGLTYEDHLEYLASLGMEGESGRDAASPAPRKNSNNSPSSSTSAAAYITGYRHNIPKSDAIKDVENKHLSLIEQKRRAEADKRRRETQKMLAAKYRELTAAHAATAAREEKSGLKWSSSSPRKSNNYIHQVGSGAHIGGGVGVSVGGNLIIGAGAGSGLVERVRSNTNNGDHHHHHGRLSPAPQQQQASMVVVGHGGIHEAPTTNTVLPSSSAAGINVGSSGLGSTSSIAGAVMRNKIVMQKRRERAISARQQRDWERAERRRLRALEEEEEVARRLEEHEYVYGEEEVGQEGEGEGDFDAAGAEDSNRRRYVQGEDGEYCYYEDGEDGNYYHDDTGDEHGGGAAARGEGYYDENGNFIEDNDEGAENGQMGDQEGEGEGPVMEESYNVAGGADSFGAELANGGDGSINDPALLIGTAATASSANHPPRRLATPRAGHTRTTRINRRVEDDDNEEQQQQQVHIRREALTAVKPSPPSSPPRTFEREDTAPSAPPSLPLPPSVTEEEEDGASNNAPTASTSITRAPLSSFKLLPKQGWAASEGAAIRPPSSSAGNEFASPNDNDGNTNARDANGGGDDNYDAEMEQEEEGNPDNNADTLNAGNATEDENDENEEGFVNDETAIADQTNSFINALTANPAANESFRSLLDYLQQLPFLSEDRHVDASSKSSTNADPSHKGAAEFVDLLTSFQKISKNNRSRQQHDNNADNAHEKTSCEDEAVGDGTVSAKKPHENDGDALLKLLVNRPIPKQGFCASIIGTPLPSLPPLPADILTKSSSLEQLLFLSPQERRRRQKLEQEEARRRRREKEAEAARLEAEKKLHSNEVNARLSALRLLRRELPLLPEEAARVKAEAEAVEREKRARMSLSVNSTFRTNITFDSHANEKVGGCAPSPPSSSTMASLLPPTAVSVKNTLKALLLECKRGYSSLVEKADSTNVSGITSVPDDESAYLPAAVTSPSFAIPPALLLHSSTPSFNGTNLTSRLPSQQQGTAEQQGEGGEVNAVASPSSTAAPSPSSLLLCDERVVCTAYSNMTSREQKAFLAAHPNPISTATEEEKDEQKGEAKVQEEQPELPEKETSQPDADDVKNTLMIHPTERHTRLLNRIFAAADKGNKTSEAKENEAKEDDLPSSSPPPPPPPLPIHPHWESSRTIVSIKSIATRVSDPFATTQCDDNAEDDGGDDWDEGGRKGGGEEEEADEEHGTAAGGAMSNLSPNNNYKSTSPAGDEGDDFEDDADEDYAETSNVFGEDALPATGGGDDEDDTNMSPTRRKLMKTRVPASKKKNSPSALEKERKARLRAEKEEQEAMRQRQMLKLMPTAALATNKGYKEPAWMKEERKRKQQNEEAIAAAREEAAARKRMLAEQAYAAWANSKGAAAGSPANSKAKRTTAAEDSKRLSSPSPQKVPLRTQSPSLKVNSTKKKAVPPIADVTVVTLPQIRSYIVELLASIEGNNDHDGGDGDQRSSTTPMLPTWHPFPDLTLRRPAATDASSQFPVHPLLAKTHSLLVIKFLLTEVRKSLLHQGLTQLQENISLDALTAFIGQSVRWKEDHHDAVDADVDVNEVKNHHQHHPRGAMGLSPNRTRKRMESRCFSIAGVGEGSHFYWEEENEDHQQQQQQNNASSSSSLVVAPLFPDATSQAQCLRFVAQYNIESAMDAACASDLSVGEKSVLRLVSNCLTSKKNSNRSASKKTKSLPVVNAADNDSAFLFAAQLFATDPQGAVEYYTEQHLEAFRSQQQRGDENKAEEGGGVKKKKNTSSASSAVAVPLRHHQPYYHMLVDDDAVSSSSTSSSAETNERKLMQLVLAKLAKDAFLVGPVKALEAEGEDGRGRGGGGGGVSTSLFPSPSSREGSDQRQHDEGNRSPSQPKREGGRGAERLPCKRYSLNAKEASRLLLRKLSDDHNNTTTATTHADESDDGVDAHNNEKVDEEDGDLILSDKNLLVGTSPTTSTAAQRYPSPNRPLCCCSSGAFATRSKIMLVGFNTTTSSTPSSSQQQQQIDEEKINIAILHDYGAMLSALYSCCDTATSTSTPRLANKIIVRPIAEAQRLFFGATMGGSPATEGNSTASTAAAGNCSDMDSPLFRRFISLCIVLRRLILGSNVREEALLRCFFSSTTTVEATNNGDARVNADDSPSRVLSGFANPFFENTFALSKAAIAAGLVGAGDVSASDVERTGEEGITNHSHHDDPTLVIASVTTPWVLPDLLLKSVATSPMAATALLEAVYIPMVASFLLENDGDFSFDEDNDDDEDEHAALSDE